MKRDRTISRRTAEGDISGLPAGFSPVLRRVLAGRGVRDASELSLGLADMQKPGSLSGLAEAAGLLADAVTGDQRILVVGDFDADGATGTALALLSLHAMGCRRADFHALACTPVERLTLDRGRAERIATEWRLCSSTT